MFITVGVISPSDPKILPRKTHIRCDDIVVIATGSMKTAPGAAGLVQEITVLSVRHVGDLFVNEKPDVVAQMIKDETFRSAAQKAVMALK